MTKVSRLLQRLTIETIPKTNFTNVISSLNFLLNRSQISITPYAPSPTTAGRDRRHVGQQPSRPGTPSQQQQQQQQQQFDQEEVHLRHSKEQRQEASF